MNSKKSISLLILIVAVFVLIICAAYILNQKDANSYTDSSGKYIMHSSYSLENVTYPSDSGSAEYQTKLSYNATIRGTKEDMKNISIALRVNMDYYDLVILKDELVIDEDLLGHDLHLKGCLTFDTAKMIEEGVSATDLLEGIEIEDKDGNKYVLYFNFI